MLICLHESVLTDWHHSAAALPVTFKFHIIHHCWNKLTQPFCKHLDLKKNRLQSEMPGEVTDWSSPHFVHPRWRETAAELNRYRSSTERLWVGACIITRAVAQWCWSHWKYLIILISSLLRRDSLISDLGQTFYFYTFRDEPVAFLALDLTFHNSHMLF